MATSSIFPLQNAIKKILDDPNSRPKLPNKSLDGGDTSTGGGFSVGSSFSDNEEYGKGSAPDISLNNSNVVVEVHEGLTEDTIDYQVGRISGKNVNWNKRQKYDTGVQPSVALNDNGIVVEVHQSESFDSLYYRIGGVKDDEITFSKSHFYDKGVRPSVAINNEELIVEVHSSENFNSLYYHVGSIYGNTIKFGESHYYDKGIRPSVAINDEGLVVEVHQSQSHESLWYRIGLIGGNTIEWFNDGESVKYAKGKRPAVAVTSDGQVIVVHQKGDTLWHRIGQVNEDKIDWLFESKQYNKRGVAPAIACNDAIAVEIHSSKTRKALSASVMTLRASHPKWLKIQGKYSYLYFSMEEKEAIDERTVTRETITVKPGAPFLAASITNNRDSAEFPTGAVLSIIGPSGIEYAQEGSNDNFTVAKSGSSLWSLLIKEPEAGDYRVSLTVPTKVTFSFVFETLPYRDVLKTIAGSRGLQKRGSNGKSLVENPGVQQAIEVIGFVWVTFRRNGRRIQMLEQNAQYFTGSNSPVLEGTPATLTDATSTIAQNIQIREFNQMIQPPDVPTRPVGNGPITGYVRNQAGALQWLQAEIRIEHLDTGTNTNQAVRTFARRLGLPTDDAGHAIAARLGGTGTSEWNIFPQVVNFNRGVYRVEIEDLIYRAVRNQGLVRVWLIFHYDGNGLLPNRPIRIDILYLLRDGTTQISDIYNPERVPRGW